MHVALNKCYFMFFFYILILGPWKQVMDLHVKTEKQEYTGTLNITHTIMTLTLI